MAGILKARKHGDCVRLEIAAAAKKETLEFLTKALELGQDDIFTTTAPIDLAAFWHLTDLPGFDSLKYEPWPPQPSPDIEPGGSMFDVVGARDILLIHPYQSFEPVVRLIEEAAADPDVLAIKQILYRTSKREPDRRRSGQGRPAGQIRDGDRRAQGPLRRGPQHRMGQKPGRARRAGDLRREGAEDPRQNLHHRPPRAARHRALRPFRHRQLQRDHLADLQRRQLPDQQRRAGGRRHQLLQRHHRLFAAAAVSQDRSRPDRHAAAAFWS